MNKLQTALARKKNTTSEPSGEPEESFESIRRDRGDAYTPIKAEFNPKYQYFSRDRSGDVDRRIQEEDLSPDQLGALCKIERACSWSLFSSFGGYAGTGKSTLIPLISRRLRDTLTTAFAAFTGKAANVMDRKLKTAGVFEMAYIGTIHRLIYQPLTDDNGNISSWRLKGKPLLVDGTPITRIILDEASMVGSALMRDLRNYNIPILAVGDHGQLLPVNDTSIMEEPDICLTQIHRQAAKNPIIQLANIVRQEGDLPKGFPSSDEIRFCGIEEVLQEIGDSYERLKENMAILVRTNIERKRFNLEPRPVREPVPGDIVICLKNAPPIYNGMRGILQRIKPVGTHWYDAAVRFEDDGIEISGLFNKHQFGMDKTIGTAFNLQQMGINYPRNTQLGLLFDFGVALTVHKSQGSAFEDVFLFPNRWSRDTKEDYAKWLYTAVTRASKRLFICNG